MSIGAGRAPLAIMGIAMSVRFGCARCGGGFAAASRPSHEEEPLMVFEVSRLSRRHALLDQEILDERRRPFPDQFKLQGLKRRKLAVKERLHALAPGGLAPA
jgi:hypothetical protein